MTVRDFFCAAFAFVLCCGTAFSGDLLPLKIGDATLNVEVVCTRQKREQGLQHRTDLPVDQGMLFVFPGKKSLAFWMKDTLIPLDIAFIDSEGRLFQIEAMKPLSLRPVRSQKKCALALEVSHGWFQSKGIALDTTMLIPEAVKTGVS